MKLMRGLSARLVAAAAAKMSLLAEAPKTTRLSQTQRRRQIRAWKTRALSCSARQANSRARPACDSHRYKQKHGMVP